MTTLFFAAPIEAKVTRYLTGNREDVNPPLVFSDGYEMTRTPGQSRGPEAQSGGRIGGDPVWNYSFDYTFLVGKG